MNKKIFLLIVLVLSLVVVFAGCSGVGETVANGDFSAFNEEAGAFDGWSFSVDKDNKGTFEREPANTSDEDKDKGAFLKVSTTKAGVNYLYQEVKLVKGATYKLSVDVKTRGTITGESTNFRGAFVGFIEDPNFAIDIRTTSNNKWHNYEKFFTPSTDKKLTLAVGIGHEVTGKAKGTAWFDNITLERVDNVPAGATIETVKTVGDKYSLADAGSTAFVVVGALLSVAIIVLFMYLLRKNMSRETLSNHKMLSPIALFVYMMLIAFIIRFVLAILTGGMVSELNALTNLAHKFTNVDITKIVPTTGTVLPAGILYLLWIQNGIAKLLHIGGDGFALLIRLPFILADLVAVYLIYSMVSKRYKEHTAIFMAGLYAVLPSIIMASTGWGMSISLVGCLLVAMFYCLLNRKYIGVSILYASSLLFSSMPVLLLPLVLAYLINAFARYSDARLKIGLSALGSLVGFYVFTVPFVVSYLGSGKPFFYFGMMWKELTAVNALTANAFNLYGMIGMNLGAIPKPINILNYIFVVVLMIVLVLLYLKNRDRLNIILMSSFTLIAISTLCPRGSVETMVLGVVLLLVYAVVANSRRIYGLLGGFSILSFLNISLIMSNSGFISNQLNATKLVDFFKLDPTFIAMSVIAVLMTLYMGYVVFDVCYRERNYDLPPMNGKLKDDFKTRYELFKERRRARHTASESVKED